MKVFLKCLIPGEIGVDGKFPIFRDKEKTQKYSIRDNTIRCVGFQLNHCYLFDCVVKHPDTVFYPRLESVTHITDYGTVEHPDEKTVFKEF